ncbi:type I methionyl aminopeptidase [Candidatus Dependentiae bacterium]|nr:MAG: type I methionyl aminopeptidase [Candidatus Dependentiae bacterium]
MIKIKNKASLQKMETAGKLLVEIFDEIASLIAPGLTALAIDRAIEQSIKKKGLLSRTKGYMGYKHASCISINDEVVHGVPSDQKVLKDGDLVKIDVCASWRGYCADMARSFYVGCASEPVQRFISNVQRALNKGIEQVRVGNTLGDISAAIQREVEKDGFSIVRDFAGHGIGKQMHEEPEILNYGEAGKGVKLQAGMVFAIEPMITMGKHDVYVDRDGWTVKTADKSLAAHVEDTVVVTESGPKILTRANTARAV